jgi:hypothetical protein
MTFFSSFVIDAVVRATGRTALPELLAMGGVSLLIADGRRVDGMLTPRSDPPLTPF